MSWKPEIKVHGENDFHTNALRFATKDESDQYALDLFRRWMMANEYRSTQCDDPVNYKWESGQAIPLPKAEVNG